MEIKVGNCKIDVKEKDIEDMKKLAGSGFNVVLEQVIISTYPKAMCSDLQNYELNKDLTDLVGQNVYTGYIKV